MKYIEHSIAMRRKAEIDEMTTAELWSEIIFGVRKQVCNLPIIETFTGEYEMIVDRYHNAVGSIKFRERIVQLQELATKATNHYAALTEG